MRTLAAAAVAGLALVSPGLSVSTSAASTGHRVPIDSTQIVTLPMCLSTEDLDCIDAVRVVRNGKALRASLISPPENPTTWRYADVNGDPISFSLRGVMTPLGYVRPDPVQPHRADVYVEIWREPDHQHPWRDISQVDCSSGTLSDCVEGDAPFPESDRFEVDVRTSWLRPLLISTAGSDFRTTWQAIPGGHIFRFSALQMLMPVVDPLSGWPPPPGWDRPRAWDARLYFIVDHAATRPGWSAYDTRCADKGFPSVARNAPVAGRPEWEGNSLNFNSIGPHFAPDGSELTGDFQAHIPLAWLRCRSGLPKLRPSMLSVSVVDDRGVPQAATTSLRATNGMLEVNAFGFHYSRPTIKLVAAHRK